MTGTETVPKASPAGFLNTMNFASGGRIPPASEFSLNPTGFVLFGFHRESGQWLKLLLIKDEAEVPQLMKQLGSKSPVHAKYRLLVAHDDFSAFTVLEAAKTYTIKYLKGPLDAQ